MLQIYSFIIRHFFKISLASSESKSAFEVNEKLEQIYLIYGTPKRLQSDDGGKFKKDVK